MLDLNLNGTWCHKILSWLWHFDIRNKSITICPYCINDLNVFTILKWPSACYTYTYLQIWSISWITIFKFILLAVLWHFEGPDYRQIGLPGHWKVPQIHNCRGGRTWEGGIEFSATASLVSAVVSCQFCQFWKKFSCRKLNYASISSCTATFDTNFHSIEFHSIGTKFTNTVTIGGWEIGHQRLNQSS